MRQPRHPACRYLAAALTVAGWTSAAPAQDSPSKNEPVPAAKKLRTATFALG